MTDFYNFVKNQCHEQIHHQWRRGRDSPEFTRDHGRGDASQCRVRRILDGRNPVHGKANPQDKIFRQIYLRHPPYGTKGGFVFPAGRFIPDSMRIFEEEILSQLPDRYTSQQDLIKDIAKVHGELLFIHPFREGNGRTFRILANLMARKQGYPGLNFKKIDFNEYIIAVQQVARKDYSRMEQIIAYTF